jgi:phosphate transport system ATP-binding protein
MILVRGWWPATWTPFVGSDAAVSTQADPAGTGAGRAAQAGPEQVPIEPPAPGQTQPTVRTLDLTLSFGPRAVLSNIGLDVQQGRITALLGPTGSGKTTLLRTFNRMNDKVSTYRHTGDVTLDGTSIWASSVDPMALRRRVGMVFQRPNPFPMSIMDNVVAGAKAHKLASRAGLREIAEYRLKEVGLWKAVGDRLKDSPFRLSGGQQQLLCLARALATEPQVLLLDEPTSSLDPITTESIEALIRTLVPRLTVIIVTHNLAQARRVSDRTVFLNAGRLVEHGETQQVFEHPAEEETARYVGGRFG